MFLPEDLCALNLDLFTLSSNIEHRTLNVEHRIMYADIYNKDKATRPPRLSEPTKGRRALSTARDGGQERLPHSTFDVEITYTGQEF